MTTKNQFFNSLINTGITIDKILAWSLKSIPKSLITKDTKVLLPHHESSAYLVRALYIGYDPTNINNSYDLCNKNNLRLFHDNIDTSIIFLSDGRCIVCPYVHNKSGDHSIVKIISNTNDKEEYDKYLKLLDDMFDISI